MADARNYKQYRREVLNRLGVQYYDEDIEDFDRWRLKVLQGLSDLYGEENILNAINAWLDEHTINFDGATASEEGEAGLVPPTSLGTKRQAREHYHLNAEGNWVVDPVWSAYSSGFNGSQVLKLKYPNSTGTAGVDVEAIGTGQKGTANGVCPLDANGKVDGSYLNTNTLIKETLKTLTTENDPLYNHNRTVTVYYDGNVLPTVNLYNEEQTSYGYARRWVYEANEVMVYTTNDHPEYGEHKAKFWFINRASSNLTQLTNGSQMICEHNANYAEGGSIEH